MEKKCLEPKCEKGARKRGYCGSDYERHRRNGHFQIREKDPIRRFWGYVVKSDGCWLWNAAKTPSGYGYMVWNGRNKPAHRIAYELLVGPIPDGLDLDHECHNRDLSCAGGPGCPHRACVNPAHLKPKTRRSNLLAGRGPMADKARRTHCPNGREFTPENTYYWKNARHCRTCRAEVTANRVRVRPPRKVVQGNCVMCGASFEFVRGPGGAVNVCSDPCRKDRQRRAARECQRRKRGGVAT